MVPLKPPGGRVPPAHLAFLRLSMTMQVGTNSGPPFPRLLVATVNSAHIPSISAASSTDISFSRQGARTKMRDRLLNSSRIYSPAACSRDLKLPECGANGDEATSHDGQASLSGQDEVSESCTRKHSRRKETTVCTDNNLPEHSF